jgi:DNA-binding phage protein
MSPPRRSPPRSKDHAALAQAIKLRIAECSEMTQWSVAQNCELSFEQVNAFARAQGNPTFETLLKLCEGLEMTLGELMTSMDTMRKLGLRS